MKPILFSTPMVKAILAGRKTQTRRVINPQPVGGVRFCNIVDAAHPRGGWQDCHGRYLARQFHVGDILYVRETWGIGLQIIGGVIYKADYTDRTVLLADGEKWHPSIHMPKEAARIFLRVTSVRVERLREITTNDVILEGVITKSEIDNLQCAGMGPRLEYARYCYRELWNSLNVKRGYGWDTNPWVFVYEFEQITKEEAEK